VAAGSRVCAGATGIHHAGSTALVDRVAVEFSSLVMASKAFDPAISLRQKIGSR
jgi:hypothetical protein